MAPWQSSILVKDNDVAFMAELEATYTTLTLVHMQETDEYSQGTYGWQTLDQRGGLTHHVVERVGHGCWLMDLVPTDRTAKCTWRPVFEQSVYPLLKPLELDRSIGSTTVRRRPSHWFVRVVWW